MSVCGGREFHSFTLRALAGFDAHVALGFDNTRKKHPWLFKAQFLNKLLYVGQPLGLCVFLSSEC